MSWESIAALESAFDEIANNPLPVDPKERFRMAAIAEREWIPPRRPGWR